ncbi:MAG: diacylglycerol kinase family protein [Bacteroidota bacterium]
MATFTRPHVIFNPAAAGGNTGRAQGTILKALEEEFPHGFSLDVTTENGQATALTRRALSNEAGLIVVVGGDGTCNEVLNGFFEHRKPIRPSARLGFISSGTGEDASRNLGLPAGLKAQIRRLHRGRRLLDVGLVRYTASDGTTHERLFLNDCQLGIAGRVVQRVTPTLKKLGGFLAYGIASTLTALTYNGHLLTIKCDRDEPIEGQFLGVAAANGRFAGGGMDFAPHSRIDDGKLDVIMIRDQSKINRLLNFPKIYSGRHIDMPWVISKKVQKVRITSDGPVPLEADGEFLGYLPCEIRVLPRILPIASSLSPRRIKPSWDQNRCHALLFILHRYLSDVPALTHRQ